MASAPEPILYSFRRCPFAMRARLALAVSGTTFDMCEVDLAAKPAALVAASPKATVPVLVLPDGRILDESLPIMHWALGRNDPEQWLKRDDGDLIAANDGEFKQALDRYKYGRDAAGALAARDLGLAFLRTIDALLADGERLGGGRRGLTDAAIVPFVRQFAAVDRAWFDDLALARVRPWLDRYVASDLFQTIMVRIPS